MNLQTLNWKVLHVSRALRAVLRKRKFAKPTSSNSKYSAIFLHTGISFFNWDFFRKYSHKIKEDQRWRAHGRGEYVSVNKATFLEKSLGKLYYPFKPNYYWWCLLIIARKFVIVVCSVLIRTDPTFQLSCVLCFMFLFMCLHIEFDPYMHVKERA